MWDSASGVGGLHTWDKSVETTVGVTANDTDVVLSLSGFIVGWFVVVSLSEALSCEVVIRRTKLPWATRRAGDLEAYRGSKLRARGRRWELRQVQLPRAPEREPTALGAFPHVISPSWPQGLVMSFLGAHANGFLPPAGQGRLTGTFFFRSQWPFPLEPNPFAGKGSPCLGLRKVPPTALSRTVHKSQCYPAPARIAARRKDFLSDSDEMSPLLVHNAPPTHRLTTRPTIAKSSHGFERCPGGFDRRYFILFTVHLCNTNL